MQGGPPLLSSQASGLDVPFVDLWIVTASGATFPANQAVLSCHSIVLRGMFESCKPAGHPGTNEASDGSSMRIVFEDTDEQVEALVRYCHDPTSLAHLLEREPDWVDLVPLLQVLFKYDIQGRSGERSFESLFFARKTTVRCPTCPAGPCVVDESLQTDHATRF